MTDTITAHELRFERLLDADVDTVWRYLTDEELRGRWFMPGALDPRVGGAMGFRAAHADLSDDDVPTPEKYAPFQGKAWDERVVAIDPPRLLAFTWDEGKSGEVTIELTPEGARTRLVLTHRDVPDRAGALNFAGGWGSHLDTLERRLRGERVPDFWALHAAAEARAEARAEASLGASPA